MSVHFTSAHRAASTKFSELTSAFSLIRCVSAVGEQTYKVEPKDFDPSAERIADETFLELVHLAANQIQADSPHKDLLATREFQAFARGIPGAEHLSSKLKRALDKAAYLGKGLVSMAPAGKVLDERYWQEALISSHPSGAELEDFFDVWKTSRSGLAFEEWLMQKPARLHPPSITYLTPEERKEFAVTFTEGRLYQKGAPLSTGKIQTDKESGAAIYVILSDEVMYVGPYLLSRFQHSSFNCGQPVIGAGEILTDPEGNILEISSKSGHYKPTPQQLADTVAFLEKMGIDLDYIHVVENSEEGIKRHESARDFLTLARSISSGSTSPMKSPMRTPAPSPSGAGADFF